MIENVLRNINCFVDGFGHRGKCTEIELPKLGLKTEDHRAAGMDGPVSLEMGMEKLMASFTLQTIEDQVLAKFGVGTGKTVPLTFRGTLEGHNGRCVSVVVNIAAVITEVDPGSWQPGQKSTTKYTVECRDYKYTQGGNLIHHINHEEFVRIIDGVNVLEKQAQHLGF